MTTSTASTALPELRQPRQDLSALFPEHREVIDGALQELRTNACRR